MIQQKSDQLSTGVTAVQTPATPQHTNLVSYRVAASVFWLRCEGHTAHQLSACQRGDAIIVHSQNAQLVIPRWCQITQLEVLVVSWDHPERQFDWFCPAFGVKREKITIFLVAILDFSFEMFTRCELPSKVKGLVSVNSSKDEARNSGLSR